MHRMESILEEPLRLSYQELPFQGDGVYYGVYRRMYPIVFPPMILVSNHAGELFPKMGDKHAGTSWDARNNTVSGVRTVTPHVRFTP